jgi:hypothetical protein
MSAMLRWLAVLICAGVFACNGRGKTDLSSTTLRVRITDESTGKPIAARVLLFDASGAPLHIGTIDLYGKRQTASACAIAPGVIGSWDGLIFAYGEGDIAIGADRCDPSPAIAYGSYTVWAWHGVEYDKWVGRIDLQPSAGNVELPIKLTRAWTPTGTLSADLHVHAKASGDSLVPNPTRVIAQVAAGVQVIGLSDHNINGDLDQEIHDLHLDDVVTSIASNELSSETSHVGVYPVTVQRDKPQNGGPPASQTDSANASQLLSLARAFPGKPVVQVNHPRFRVTAMFDATGWNGITWPPPFPVNFDAVEVLNGHTAFNFAGDRRIDESVRDYYTFTDHGFLVAPLGNSDTHHLNGVHDALCRNYVFSDDVRVNPFDEAAFVVAIKQRRVVATSGPWLDVEVKPSDAVGWSVGPGRHVMPTLEGVDKRVWVDVTLQQANFVKTDAIRIMVGTATGPAVAQRIEVAPNQRSTHWAGWISVGEVDTWIGVDAGGDTPLPIELTGTYQVEKKRAGVTPYAIIGAILVDTDNNGRWQRGQSDVELVP